MATSDAERHPYNLEHPHGFEDKDRSQIIPSPLSAARLIVIYCSTVSVSVLPQQAGSARWPEFIPLHLKGRFLLQLHARNHPRTLCLTCVLHSNKTISPGNNVFDSRLIIDTSYSYVPYLSLSSSIHPLIAACSSIPIHFLSPPTSQSTTLHELYSSYLPLPLMVPSNNYSSR